MKRILGLFFCILVISNHLMAASPNEEAKRILEKISGVKVAPDHPLLVQMIPLVKSGNYLEAAQLATQHPQFLNITVKLMALQMSTREENFRQSLNDFAASFIGVTRDETDARELLMGNFYYKGGSDQEGQIPNAMAGVDGNGNPTIVYNGKVTVRNNVLNDIAGTNNNHFADLEKPGINIGAVLVRVNSQPLTDSTGNLVVENKDAAGVLTSQAFMKAHATAGTNRRAVEFAMREFMCAPIETWSDTKVADLRIGRDVDRFPGGDHQKFLTTCKGCHNVMDGFRGAFAKWDVQNNRLKHAESATGGPFDTNNTLGILRVARKMNQNDTVFPSGYITKNDSFINNAIGTANAELFGWRGRRTTGGAGVKEFGELIANSQRFSQCMVKRVYEATCRKGIDIKASSSFISQLANKFEQNNYNLKRLFQEVVVSKECI